MIPRESLKKRLSLSGILVIWISVSAFSLSTLPPVVVLSWIELVETECPAQEDGEETEEKLETFSSTRHRVNNRRRVILYRILDRCSGSAQTTFSFPHYPTIIGHQLTNGLCAPLLV